MNSTSQEDLRRQLTFIENPIKRLQEMLRHGLVIDAEEALRALLNESSPIFFQHPERCDHTERIGEFVSKDGFKVCFGMKTTQYREGPTICFDPDGIQVAMGWSDKQRDDFMVEVMRKAISINPRKLKGEIASWAGSWEINATDRAMERFITMGHELRRAVELWILRAYFFEGAYLSNGGFDDEMEVKWLGKKVGDFPYSHNTWKRTVRNLERQKAYMEAVVARLMEWGMSEDEVVEDCLAWLDRFVDDLNPDFIVGVATVRVLRRRRCDRRDEIMAREVKAAIKWMMNGYALFHPLVVAELIEGGMLDTGQALEQARTLYRHYATKRLAEGKIGFLQAIGQMISLRIFGVDQPSFREPAKPRFEINQCAAGAFDLAWQRGEYGIAATLVFQFGEDACIDPELLRERANSLVKEEGDEDGLEEKLAELVEERRTQIRTVAELARTTGKPTRLDYSTVFVPQL
jgi:hypothetical protein